MALRDSLDLIRAVNPEGGYAVLEHEITLPMRCGDRIEVSLLKDILGRFRLASARFRLEHPNVRLQMTGRRRVAPCAEIALSDVMLTLVLFCLRHARDYALMIGPRPNFGVKLARPGFGPAAELPASAPA